MAQRRKTWCPHASERTGHGWPLRNQFWSGWLSHTEYNIIEKYIRHGINNHESLASWDQTTADNARKNITLLLESGLLRGEIRRYELTSIGRKLYHQTDQHILTTETGELMHTVVIGDIHARWNKFKALMQKIGAMDKDGNRLAGYRFIQLGDAVSLGYGEEEADFYRWFMWEWMRDDDVCLIGNHELPAITGNPRLEFYGWDRRDQECADLVLAAYQQDRYQVAEPYTSEDGHQWLFTHAGLSQLQLMYPETGMRKYYLGDMDHEEIADWLNAGMRERIRQPDEFSYATDALIGTDAIIGGVFWVRPGPNVWGGYDKPFGQMFGHTPRGPMDLADTKGYKIDVEPGKLILLDTTPHPDLDCEMDERRQDMWGGVACAVFDTGHGAPRIEEVPAGLTRVSG